MSCLPPVKGIPYDFDGSLSLESRYIILAQYVCEMKKAIDEHMTDWFEDWVKENLDNMLQKLTLTVLEDFNVRKEHRK